jgi:hypothetical protein
MNTTKAAATPTIYRAAFGSIGGYGLDAYGRTEDEARQLLLKAARKFAKQNRFRLEADALEYYGADVTPVVLGCAFVEGSDTPIIGTF